MISATFKSIFKNICCQILLQYTNLKGEKGSLEGVIRAHRKSFKLDLKGENLKIRFTAHKSGDDMIIFEEWCVRSFSLTPE